jgi:hypothetical protein
MPRNLSHFELRAELNRGYFAEHGCYPAPGFWLGDAEYLAEVRANQAARAAEQARRRAEKNAADAERFKRLRIEHAPVRNSRRPEPSLDRVLGATTPAAPAPALVLVSEPAMRPGPVSVRATPTFEPCRTSNHEACARAYFDDAGAPVRCPCTCHVQGAMFAKPKPQRSLF